MTNYRGWKTWSVAHKDDPERAIAFFQSRGRCEEYIDLKREQALFAAGRDNETVQYWNRENFRIDYSFTLCRPSVTSIIAPNFNDWNHD
jgi:hypothetical protein